MGGTPLPGREPRDRLSKPFPQTVRIPVTSPAPSGPCLATCQLPESTTAGLGHHEGWGPGCGEECLAGISFTLSPPTPPPHREQPYRLLPPKSKGWVGLMPFAPCRRGDTGSAGTPGTDRNATSFPQARTEVLDMGARPLRARAGLAAEGFPVLLLSPPNHCPHWDVCCWFGAYGHGSQAQDSPWSCLRCGFHQIGSSDLVTNPSLTAARTKQAHILMPCSSTHRWHGVN